MAVTLTLNQVSFSECVTGEVEWIEIQEIGGTSYTAGTTPFTIAGTPNCSIRQQALSPSDGTNATMGLGIYTGDSPGVLTLTDTVNNVSITLSVGGSVPLTPVTGRYWFVGAGVGTTRYVNVAPQAVGSTTYWFQVIARNATGAAPAHTGTAVTSSYWTGSIPGGWGIGGTIKGPASPGSGANSIVVTWDAVPGAATYDVYVSTNGTFTNLVSSAQAGTTFTYTGQAGSTHTPSTTDSSSTGSDSNDGYDGIGAGISSGTYTASTKTLTGTSSKVFTVTAGQQIYVTAATGITPGLYTLVSGSGTGTTATVVLSVSGVSPTYGALPALPAPTTNGTAISTSTGPFATIKGVLIAVPNSGDCIKVLPGTTWDAFTTTLPSEVNLAGYGIDTSFLMNSANTPAAAYGVHASTGNTQWDTCDWSDLTFEAMGVSLIGVVGGHGNGSSGYDMNYYRCRFSAYQYAFHPCGPNGTRMTDCVLTGAGYSVKWEVATVYGMCVNSRRCLFSTPGYGWTSYGIIGNIWQQSAGVGCYRDCDINTGVESNQWAVGGQYGISLGNNSSQHPSDATLINCKFNGVGPDMLSDTYASSWLRNTAISQDSANTNAPTISSVGTYLVDPLILAQSSDPGISNVKSGTTYEINGTNLTGTYSGGSVAPQNIGPVTTSVSSANTWSPWQTVTPTATSNTALSLTVSVPGDGSSGNTISNISWEVWATQYSGGVPYKAGGWDTAECLGGAKLLANNTQQIPAGNTIPYLVNLQGPVYSLQFRHKYTNNTTSVSSTVNFQGEL